MSWQKEKRPPFMIFDWTISDWQRLKRGYCTNDLGLVMVFIRRFFYWIWDHLIYNYWKNETDKEIYYRKLKRWRKLT